MQQFDGIWRRVREKQALEEAARRLCAGRSGRLAMKLSISAAVGLAMSLMPVAGAARCFL